LIFSSYFLAIFDIAATSPAFDYYACASASAAIYGSFRFLLLRFFRQLIIRFIIAIYFD
jgi:hypothetical protein